MKRSSLIFLFLSWVLPVLSQNNRVNFQTQLGLVHQVDKNYPNNSLGVKGGFGVYRQVNFGILGLEGDLIHLSGKESENDFAGFSYSVKFNLLFKTWAIRDRHLYLGPGIGVFGSFSNPGVTNGYGFKALYPIQIAKMPMYLGYDFDLNLFGYYRNSLGLSYWF